MRSALITSAALAGLIGLSAAVPAQAQPAATADAVSPATAACTARPGFSLVVHGGTMDYEGQETAPRLAHLTTVLADGRERLARGEPALAVVEAVLRQIEDSGLYNAGRGANLNAAGDGEVDASIMNGRTGRAGSVASMRGIKNPITAARLVMEKTQNVMFVGDRGETLVTRLGAERVGPDYFVKRKVEPRQPPHGTAGAVALDRCGDIAAGTSTGGFGTKIPGRVGDTPIIGAATYADNTIGGFSATGHGESFMQVAAAKDVAARMAYGRQPLGKAMDSLIVEHFSAAKIEAGMIGLTPKGEIHMAFSQIGMFRGYVTDQRPIWVGATEPDRAPR